MAFSLDPDKASDSDIIEAIKADELRGRIQMDGWGVERADQLVEELEEAGFSEVDLPWGSHKAIRIKALSDGTHCVVVHCYQFAMIDAARIE